MIDSQAVLYSAGANDELYTPAYAVKPLLKYIPKGKVIWTPFDTAESAFVKVLSQQNKVIFSHIAAGQDFYKYEPSEHWDLLISNPPFTGKTEIFKRALSFGKGICLLMTLTWLNDSAPKKIFKEKELELLMFDKRIHFIKPDGTVDKKTTFSSAYYCHGFLPKQIIMEELIRE